MRVATVLLLGVVLVSPAEAQERMEVVVRLGNGPAIAELDVSVSGFGAVRHVTPIPPAPGPRQAIDQPFAIAGGRYMAWLNVNTVSSADGKSLSVFDRRTRTVAHLGVVAASRLLADPARPRVFFVGQAGDAYVVDASDQSTRYLFPAHFRRAIGAVAYAPAADVFAAATATMLGSFPGTVTTEIQLIDVATGVRLRTLPVTELPTQMAISADAGTHFLYRESGATCTPQGCPVVAYDSVTGLETARSVPFPFSGSAPMLLDEARGLLFFQLQSHGRLAVLDARTLALIADLPVVAPGDFFAMLLGRGMTGAYIARKANMLCDGVWLDALDLTGRRRDSVNLQVAFGLADCPALYGPIFRSPATPVGTVSQSTGHHVSLHWLDPGDTTEFQVQVGLLPGTTALTFSTGHASGAEVDGVPSGTYFVRIVALNEVGRSAPSTELTITVP